MDIKEKNGVKYFFDNGEAATDIEVAPEVEELMLKYSLQMPKSKKSFPNVKKLIIEKDVWDIKIPNTLFPNVREVVSHTETFLSGKYLLKKDGFTYLKMCSALIRMIQLFCRRYMLSMPCFCWM